MFVSALMGFGAVLWVGIYRLMGVYYAVGVPFGYLALSALLLAVYAILALAFFFMPHGA